MTDRRTRRLELLRRLREMHVEQARADHVAALAELEACRERAETTLRGIEALGQWTAERLARGEPVAPELLRQAQLLRRAEQAVLEQQRAAETEQGEVTESARGELNGRFEELSVAERLAERHTRNLGHEELRRGYIELDEAGARKSMQAKE